MEVTVNNSKSKNGKTDERPNKKARNGSKTPNKDKRKVTVVEEDDRVTIHVRLDDFSDTETGMNKTNNATPDGSPTKVGNMEFSMKKKWENKDDSDNDESDSSSENETDSSSDEESSEDETDLDEDTWPPKAKRSKFKSPEQNVRGSSQESSSDFTPSMQDWAVYLALYEELLQNVLKIRAEKSGSQSANQTEVAVSGKIANHGNSKQKCADNQVGGKSKVETSNKRKRGKNKDKKSKPNKDKTSESAIRKANKRLEFASSPSDTTVYTRMANHSLSSSLDSSFNRSLEDSINKSLSFIRNSNCSSDEFLSCDESFTEGHGLSQPGTSGASGAETKEEREQRLKLSQGHIGCRECQGGHDKTTS